MPEYISVRIVIDPATGHWRKIRRGPPKVGSGAVTRPAKPVLALVEDLRIPDLEGALIPGGDKEEKKKKENEKEEGHLPILGLPSPHPDGIKLGGDKEEKKEEEEKEEGQLIAPGMPSPHPDGIH